jgi:tRNA-dihydrouridine synthase
MIGRGAISNPWIFQQSAAMEQGLGESRPGPWERRAFLLEHFTLLCESMEERRAALAVRGLVLACTRGLPHSSRLRGRIAQIRDGETLISTMDHYFSTLENLPS